MKYAPPSRKSNHALLFAGPLAYMKKITALRHVSLVALTCVLLITVMIFLFAFDLDDGLEPPALRDGVVVKRLR